MRALKASYRTIFFDLDHTLWDYTGNSEETLRELYQKYQLNRLGAFCQDTFCKTFDTVNRELWEQKEGGKLGRDQMRSERFVRVLNALGAHAVPETVTAGLDKDFIALCPSKPGLLPYAREVLEHFHRRYPLYVLTNGFREVQDIKLRSAGIEQYFSGIFTAEDAGVSKPDPLFFRHALEATGSKAGDCLMIGDNLKADIIGALSAGIDSVYYNPFKRRYHVPVQREIQCLSELMKLF